VFRKERKRNFVRRHPWVRGLFVNTVGRDEDAIRAYICQEKEDQRLEQLNLWPLTTPPLSGS
jgi:putative transposase